MSLESVFSTSFHADHPASSVVDGSPKTFWATTGGLPQEIVVRFVAGRCSFSSVRVVCANIRHLIVEKSEGSTPSSWTPYDEQELPDVETRQDVTLRNAVGGPTAATYLRFRITALHGGSAFGAIYLVTTDAAAGGRI